jgi:DNA-binding NarL/FixJ family response regulator
MAHALDRLSPRERASVTCVREGLTPHDIARRLCVSAQTVEAHGANIRRTVERGSQTDTQK